MTLKLPMMALAGFVALGMVPSVAAAADTAAEQFRDQFLNGELTWDDVSARARQEGEVNWFHWGGSEQLNSWIEQVAAPEMKKLGVTLKTTRLAGTREAVDLVLTEKQAGRGVGEGSVDLIWLNGDNFYTLSSQDALFGSFAEKLPQSRNFEFDSTDPRSQLNLSDFGTPTGGQEMPWSGEQYICYADMARLPRQEAPADFEELEGWLKENPGRFTYVKPPHYIGNTFVQTVLYAFNPSGRGYQDFQKPIEEFTPEALAEIMLPGFEYLKRIEPHLLPVYPQNQQANQALYNNGEVDLACEFGLYLVDSYRKTGAFSETTETLLFPNTGMIKNKNFLTIPVNAPHPAAALVFADLMSRFDMQASKLEKIGYPLGIDRWKLSKQQQETANSVAPSHFGVTAEDLAAVAVPDTNASLVKVIERVWQAYIERKSDKPFPEIVLNAMKAG
ncbi:ABC transporter substrate-binding protein [Sneathiella chinensis]|uniref:ABC transporter substrate-binding protein n=1 Tax=Sneathiella chinensis TaxID=349750 RepID=A0ABQ5U4G9_9PROT|nr:ABC transporter substrate-binding protein [Sneathiella chinensis]GLQ06646.1 ABC transporter substrate-binding protein [Sneathiella chinensis]